MKRLRTYFGLFLLTLCFSLNAQVGFRSYVKKNSKGEFMVREISVTYDYSDKDWYKLTFDYNPDGSYKRMTHWYEGHRDIYDIGTDSQGLKHIKYSSFKYRQGENGKVIQTEDKSVKKEWSFNKMGKLFKKHVYIDNMRYLEIYTFLYNWQGKLDSIKFEYEDKEEPLYSKVLRAKTFWVNEDKWFSGMDGTQVYTNDKRLGTAYLKTDYYFYQGLNNLANFDFNVLLFGYTFKTSPEFGMGGFVFDKLSYFMACDKEKQEDNNEQYKYEFKKLSDVPTKITKWIDGTDSQNRKYRREYMVMEIRYEIIDEYKDFDFDF